MEVKIKEYDEVELLTEEYISEEVAKGSIGYIIENYDNGNFEVDFSNKDTGITIAQLVVKEDSLKLLD